MLVNQSTQIEKKTGIESLIHEIFYIKKYNNIVRPVDKSNNLTNILTELKLLKIDMVIKIIINNNFK